MTILNTLFLTDLNHRLELLSQGTKHYFVFELLRGKIFLDFITADSSIKCTTLAEFIPRFIENVILSFFLLMSLTHLGF